MSIAELVQRSVSRWTWREFALAHPRLAHLQHGAMLKPLQRLLRLRSKHWTGQTAALEAAVTRAMPCQQLLHAMGYVQDPLCLLCGREEGSYVHRWWSCAMTQGAREPISNQLLVANLQAEAAVAALPLYGEGLFGQGLIPDPGMRCLPPVNSWEWSWPVPVADGCLEGAVFLATFSVHRREPLLQRSGLGLAQIDRALVVVGSAAAPMPGLLQEPARGAIMLARDPSSCVFLQ